MRHAKYWDVEWQCDIYVACWYFVGHQSYNFRMKALQFFLILISLIFTGCMAKWQGFGTLEAGMTGNQVQKAYGEPFQNVLLKRTDGGFIEFWFFDSPRPPYGSKPIAFKNGKLVSWGDEVEELFAEIEPIEVYKLQPKPRK
jgi:hypothetical protein